MFSNVLFSRVFHNIQSNTNLTMSSTDLSSLSIDTLENMDFINKCHITAVRYVFHVLRCVVLKVNLIHLSNTNLILSSRYLFSPSNDTSEHIDFINNLYFRIITSATFAYHVLQSMSIDTNLKYSLKCKLNNVFWIPI